MIMHLKRTEAPVFWPIERKTAKFAVAPRPGAHAKKRSIPLGIILRDILKYGENMKEAKAILNKGVVRIDGKIRKDHKFPVGLMDIVATGDESYRVVSGAKGLQLKKISEGEAKLKLLKIINKGHLSKGRVQLNLYDGRKLIVSKGDYRTRDTIVFDIEKKEIKGILKMKKGSVVLITGGNKTGKTGRVLDVVVTRNPQPNSVVLETDGGKISIPESYIFVVGDDKPAISI